MSLEKIEARDAAAVKPEALRAAARAVTEDASPNSDGALRLGGDATVKAELILALREALS